EKIYPICRDNCRMDNILRMVRYLLVYIIAARLADKPKFIHYICTVYLSRHYDESYAMRSYLR
ncbi:MAG: hypothetical protein RR371_04275, partial [Bacteroides sp.]